MKRTYIQPQIITRVIKVRTRILQTSNEEVNLGGDKNGKWNADTKEIYDNNFSIW